MEERELAQNRRLRDFRKKNGYTQEQFAEILEITTSGYKKIESGECRLTKERIIMLTEKLNISEGYLLFGNRPNMDNAWVQIMGLSDREKMYILLRLNEYFVKIKKSSAFETEELVDVDKKIHMIIDDIMDGIE